MSICIERLQGWFGRHPKLREWAWFCALWLGGLGAVTALAYPLEWLVRLAR